ncbi:MAG: thiamine-phosphate kinase [Bacteroidota bacterium]
MSEEFKRTEIESLGEFKLIERINEKFKLKNKSSIIGIGDDAAVLNFDDKQIVVSSDILLEGVHFDLSYAPLPHLGYKAVSVNVSDIAAMNAIPTQITVNISISNRFSVEAVDALYEGINHACEDYNVDLVGGDTTASKEGLVISITAIGKADAKDITLRNGAGKNDIICVTGDLGAAYLGLQVLEREKQVFLSNPEMQPELDRYSYIVQRQLKPEAKTNIIHELRELNIKPTSMIDVSDGLASEVLHLAKSSNCGMVVYEDKLPVDDESFKTAEEFNMNIVTCALNGGEDYELLFTIQQDDFEKLKNHSNIHTIGYVTDSKSGNKLVTRSGTVAELKAQGWKHF